MLKVSRLGCWGWGQCPRSGSPGRGSFCSPPSPPPGQCRERGVVKEGLAWILRALVLGVVGEGTWPWSEPCGFGWDCLTPAVSSFLECGGSHLGKPLGSRGEPRGQLKAGSSAPGGLQEEVTEGFGIPPICGGSDSPDNPASTRSSLLMTSFHTRDLISQCDGKNLEGGEQGWGATWNLSDASMASQPHL